MFSLDAPGKDDIIGDGINENSDLGTTEGVNDSITVFTLVVSPRHSLIVQNCNFVDFFPRNTPFFTRNLRKKNLNDPDRVPRWSDMSWTGTRYGPQNKRLNVKYDDNDFNEALTAEQLNYYWFEESKTRRFQLHELTDVYNEWNLHGICMDAPAVLNQGKGERRILAQVAGRIFITNFFDGDVTTNGQRYLFYFLTFQRFNKDEKPAFNIHHDPNSRTSQVCDNFSPSIAKEKDRSNEVYDLKNGKSIDHNFTNRLVPQLVAMSSCFRYPTFKQLEYKIKKETKVSDEHEQPDDNNKPITHRGLLYPIAEVTNNRYPPKHNSEIVNGDTYSNNIVNNKNFANTNYSSGVEVNLLIEKY